MLNRASPAGIGKSRCRPLRLERRALLSKRLTKFWPASRHWMQGLSRLWSCCGPKAMATKRLRIRPPGMRPRETACLIDTMLSAELFLAGGARRLEAQARSIHPMVIKVVLDCIPRRFRELKLCKFMMQSQAKILNRHPSHTGESPAVFLD